jgi:cytochrome c biogenesis protein CcdA/thiol-disulfide isomerase/thioredoxin
VLAQMLTLVLIGFLGGLITGISPCILPVLPVVFLAGGADKPEPNANTEEHREPDPGSGGVSLATSTAVAHPKRSSRRPYAIVAGLVLSFSLFTLLGSILISALGLPDNILRVIGLTLLVLIGVGLIFPRLESWLERPFARLPQRQMGTGSGPFVLGLGLGLLYVPCAGPVLTAITVAAASHRISGNTVVLTVSFAIGATAPLLAFALAGQRVTERIAVFRRHTGTVRGVCGVVILALAAALALHLTDALQRAVPGYTDSLQHQVEGNTAFVPTLSNLTNDTNTALSHCTDGATVLQSCGPAPALKNITQWLNTPGGAPVDLSALHGKVVLIDFWAYSCINCQRAQPHITAWADTYAGDGLQVIGVHSPEFTFEADPANVAAAAHQFGITYPVALDNSLSTFTNYRNQYWPAEYLIDAAGQVRHVSFGEGHYAQTETLIRQLLDQARPGSPLPPATEVADTTPRSSTLTPETYLNFSHNTSYVGPPRLHNKPMAYQFPSSTPPNSISLSGTWSTDDDYYSAGPGARLRLSYNARAVYLVVSGNGDLTVSTPGEPDRTIPVSGIPNAYPVITRPIQRAGLLTLTLSPGLQAYDLTFG